MRIRVLMVMLCALMMTACGQFTPNDLVDTTWQLQSIHAQPIPAGMVVSMEFTADTFGGVSFCNNYGGSYERTGNTLVFAQTAMTMMACLEDNRSQLEQQHIAALGRVASYQISGDTLTLFDQSNTPLMQFMRIP
jgi:heat shock protein HslJ